jgi:hypothetical protein
MPIMNPADYDVDAGRRIFMGHVIAAFVFKFDPNTLVSILTNMSFGFTFLERSVNGFDHKTKLLNP